MLSPGTVSKRPRAPATIHARLGLSNRSNLSCAFPIRLESIVAVESGTESGICHVGPFILIEAGCVFKLALVYVKDKHLIDGIDFQCLLRYSKQLIAHLEKAAKRQNCISDAAGM